MRFSLGPGFSALLCATSCCCSSSPLYLLALYEAVASRALNVQPSSTATSNRAAANQLPPSCPNPVAAAALRSGSPVAAAAVTTVQCPAASVSCFTSCAGTPTPLQFSVSFLVSRVSDNVSWLHRHTAVVCNSSSCCCLGLDTRLLFVTLFIAILDDGQL